MTDEFWCYLDGELPPRDSPVLQFMYRKRRHSLVGPPGAAKTLTAYSCALDWVRAGYGHVLLLDYEMGKEDAQRLLIELGATDEERRLSLPYAYEKPTPPGAAEVEALGRAGVTLVVIDSTAGPYALSGLDDNKRRDIERFTQLWVNPFWNAGMSTLVLDHVTKASAKADRADVPWAIGGERKKGMTDVQLGISISQPLRRGGSAVATITASDKDRGGWLPVGPVATITFRSDPETHTLTWDVQPVGPAVERDERQADTDARLIAAAGEESGEYRSKTKTLEEYRRAGGRGDDKALRARLDALAETGALEKEPTGDGAGGYRRVHRQTSGPGDPGEPAVTDAHRGAGGVAPPLEGHPPPGGNRNNGGEPPETCPGTPDAPAGALFDANEYRQGESGRGRG